MTEKEKDFERIFKENYARLYHYALTFVDNGETCRDVVSDVFERLWAEYETLLPDSRLAYLFTCVRNRCIDILRHRQVKGRYAAFYSLDLKNGILASDRDEEERLARVEKVIDRMPPQRRFVLEQCFFHKKTYKEVAAVLGITTDGVKKHITTALRNLRDEFPDK